MIIFMVLILYLLQKYQIIFIVPVAKNTISYN
jgi:hypothetical protein